MPDEPVRPHSVGGFAANGDRIRDTVPTHMTRLLLTVAHEAGIDRAALTRIPGLNAVADEDVRIPAYSMVRLWEELSAALRESGGGTRVMRLWRPGMFGAWDYLFSTADTLVDAFETADRHFVSVSCDQGRLTVDREDSGLTIGYNGPYRYHQEFPLIAQFAAGFILAEAGSALGRPLTPTRVHLTGEPPADGRHLVDAYGTDAIEFGDWAPSVTFSLADAEAPLPRADPALAGILRHHAELSVATARPIRGWLDRFHAEVDAGFARGGPSLERVARRLNLSPRTLQRRLRDEQTSWREELERRRQSQVDRLLRQTSLPVEAIAARVGYADPRALRRAVHRWYGHGPARVRND
ncbi:MAG: AraC family transcriptional regulator ligand-binding domain-containing protein [Stackebrandtia sp.]